MTPRRAGAAAHLLAAPALALALAPGGAASAPAGDAATGAWRATLDALGARRDALAAELAATHDALRRRLTADRPDLLGRLAPEAPAPRPTGWGLLPELRPDEEPAPIAPTPRRYALADVGRWLSEAEAGAAELRARVAAAPAAQLDAAVDRQESLGERLDTVEEHLDYHRQWQDAARAWPGDFERNGRLAERLRQAREAERHGVDEGARAIRAEVAAALAPVRPPEGAALARGDDSSWTLALALVTDVEDERFLGSFTAAARAAFTDCEACRARRFALEPTIEHVASLQQVRSDWPSRGEAIDVATHLARFPPGSLVLTTGAESTHAFLGRAIVLGTAPLSPRELAHELAHLLGFQDAYLRTAEGDPTAADGLVIVEWSGVTDDLMGSPRRGLVTTDMIDRLIAAHAAR